MPLSDGQMQWRGLLLGAGPYRLQAVEGWGDLPALDVGDVNRPTGHGAWPGPRYAQGRTITADVRVVAPDDTGAAIRDLIDQTGLSGPDDEEPLTAFLWGRELVCHARLARRAVTADLGYAVGVTTVPLQWQASDPRLYDPGEAAASTGLPSPPAGFSYNITYNISYGTAGSTGNAVITNAGNADTQPLITITGDCVTPAVTHVASGRVLEFDVALTSGDVLAVDCRAGTAVLNSVASRLTTLTARSSLLRSFTLPPGSNELSFRAASGTAATMTCSRLSAWM